MENYNKYNETLNIDCCNKKTTAKTVKSSNSCCGGESLPSYNNEIEVLINQLKREVKKLMKNTEAKLLCQDKKIAETMVYIKNNLSNSIRTLLDSMLESGEMEDIITDTILEALNHKINYVTNVNEMKSFDFEIGDYVSTLGYYTSGDGGHGNYQIVNNCSLVDNGGTVIRLGNGLYALLIIENEYNVKQFGAKGDGTTDDTLSFNNLFNSVNDGDRIYIPNGKYLLNEEININKTITIYGSGSYGTELIFNECNALIFNKNFIKVKDIAVTGLNKIDTSLLNISQNNFGTVAFKFEYKTDITNGGCSIENVKIRDFNSGIVIYSTIDNYKWKYYTWNLFSYGYRLSESRNY